VNFPYTTHSLATFLLILKFGFSILVLSACSSTPTEQSQILLSAEQGTHSNSDEPIQPVVPPVDKLSPPRRPQTLQITAVGDIMLGTDYPDYRLAPNDGKDLLSGVAQILAQADITFGNLEGTFGTAGIAEKKCPDLRRCYVFRMPPRYAQYLVDSGFDVMSLANNHARDFGDSGRLLTMQVLDNYGIKHSGLMGDIAEWELKGLSIALIAFAPFRGAHDFLDLDYVHEAISALASQKDIVLVSFHAGAEGESFTHIPFETEYFHGENRGDVVLFAHTAVEAGADVVIGHGPHVPRALELYQDKLIAYSLGNFCTTLGINVAGRNGLAPILSVTINEQGDFLSGHIDSARQIRPAGPVLDKTHQAARLIKALTEHDFPATGLKISPDGNIRLNKAGLGLNILETKSDKAGLDSVK